MRLIACLCIAYVLSGCVARAAYDVATLPVRATSQVVDWTTTSRSEADRNLGRKVRRERAAQEREQRRAAKRERASPDPAPPPNR